MCNSFESRFLRYRWIRYIEAILFIVFPTIILAANEGASIGEDYFDFSIVSVADDLSMNLLAMIFGSFGGMLPAEGASVLSPLFEYFNQGVFYIAAGMVAYTGMLSIKTSEEGK